ncbi:MAG: class II aldolase/adducin family protein, partial [Candidatus Thermoplasmatota archaeon]|nr:class II aldolase/adducin family protein [Candidatus Thermoplasmatota archaeon]
MSEEHKGRTFNSPLEERVYYSRLLGRDSSLVLHGGGNTSVKVTEKDHTGKEIQVLRVKGSGSDLATITESGFTGLRMDDLLAARKIKEMTDEEMVAYMRKSMVDPSEPSPSVESFLHAFIPHAYVDHSHSDAILSITNTTMAPEEIKHILGNVMVIPYIPPGFKLARAILGSIESMGPEIRGIVLSRHGLFTFGESGKESYDRHMEIVAAAEKYINGKLKGTDLFPKKYDRTDPARVEAVLPAIRGLLSRSRKKVLKIATDEASLKISMSGEAEKLATNGPATPDMLIRTKFDYAYIEDVSKSADVIDAYAAKYREEYEKYVRGFPMHDPYPSCMVIRGFGLVTAGINSREASIAMDQMRHSLLVNARAMRLGGNSFISRKEAYDMEYWPLEEAKLKKFRPRPLEGHVSVVTGAASGIGLEVARKLSLNGSAVIACDLDPDVASVSKT